MWTHCQLFFVFGNFLRDPTMQKLLELFRCFAWQITAEKFFDKILIFHDTKDTRNLLFLVENYAIKTNIISWNTSQK